MAVMRAALLALALASASATAAHEPAPGSWLFDLRLAPEVESAPAFAKLLRETAAERLAAFQAEMIAAPPPPSCAVEVVDTASFASPEFISLRRAVTEENGGAHSNTQIEAWTWDVSENRLAELSDFAAGQLAMETMATALRKAAAAAHGDVVPPFWRGEITQIISPETLPTLPFTLAPSTEPGKTAAIDFHFSPYQIAPYAHGAQSLRVDLSVLHPLLTERARRLFGGDPQG